MTVIKHMDIAVIGDQDLVNALRLAGISRYHMIKDDHDLAGNVRKALSELLAEPDIGIAIILEDYAPHVQDILNQVKKRRGVTPVIVEVPSKFGTRHADVSEHYRALIRQSIGFEVEI
jgi:V/A-type H+/Na+-transporting ATPase subunit F